VTGERIIPGKFCRADRSTQLFVLGDGVIFFILKT